MPIIGTLPNAIANGDPDDAAPVMTNFNWIVGQVNTNSAALGGSSAQQFLVAAATLPGQAVNLGQVPAITVNNTTNAHYAVAGKNVNIANDTNLQTWADSLPRCGMYDVNLTVAQGNLHSGWWHLELQRYSSDVAGNLNHIITAKLLSAGSGLIYTNTCVDGTWTGWTQVVTSTAGTASNAATVTITVASGATGTTQAIGTNNTTMATTAYADTHVPKDAGYGGVGSFAVCQILVGSLASGATLAGGSMYATIITTSGAAQAISVTLSGTWRNVGGATSVANEFTTMQRIS